MTELKFKFHFLDSEGQQASMLSKRGQLNDTDLVLDGDPIPVAAILDVDVRGRYLVFSVATEEEEGVSLAIQTSAASQLQSRLGTLRSAIWADMREEELKQQGQSHRFRKLPCPACQATIDLTDFDETPQVHCDFCHTISTLPGDDLLEEAEPETGYRLCDECGMYSQPRQFTIFYFYFLLVVWGYHSRQTWRCPGCMRGEAWKMLFGNLPFLLGVPVALVQLIRAYSGSTKRSLFPGLDSANMKARDGKLDGAITTYRRILADRPVATGVKYNIALALLGQQRLEEGVTMLEYTLADCSNYRPAASALAGCYTELGRLDDLADLNAQWGVEEEPAGADQEAATGEPGAGESHESKESANGAG